MSIGADIHNPVLEYLIKFWRLDNPGIAVVGFEGAYEFLGHIPGTFYS